MLHENDTGGPKIRRSNSIKVLMVIASLLYLQYTAVARTIHVDANAPAGGDGSSWPAAYRYLQDALADADSNSDPNYIWVAAGVYTPDTNSYHPNGTGDRYVTFQLINGVALYGGFPSGGDPNWNDRNQETYETILSGDLDGDDVDVDDPLDLLYEPSRAENSYHIVSTSGTDATAILEGFTITSGNADGSQERRYGGGMYNYNSSPTVSNCTFVGAKATPIRGLLASWLGKVGVEFLESAYSQDLELEADALGARLVAVAGYDPHAPTQLLSRLSELSQPAKQFSLGNYFSTHPAFDVRIHNIDHLLRQRCS